MVECHILKKIANSISKIPIPQKERKQTGLSDPAQTPGGPQVRFEWLHRWRFMAAALTHILAAKVAPRSALPSRSHLTASMVARCTWMMARENHDTSIYGAGEEPKARLASRANFGELGVAVRLSAAVPLNFPPISFFASHHQHFILYFFISRSGSP